MRITPRRAVAAITVAATGVAGVVLATPSTASETPQARTELRNAANEVVGEVVFLGQGGHATRLRVVLDLPDTPNPEGYRGLHVHALGGCVAPFVTSAGGHWDDGTHTHGSHLGDLPSVLLDANGEADLESDVHRFDVSQIVGRTVILHAGRDNFGNVPVGAANDQYAPNTADATAATAATGNAGARYACGVIDGVGSN